ncbi:MAG: LiaF-related protein [Candidatus Cloacimonadota bacterium]|nr:LiaF-related protein [Candidatus Cloacimonadota bacterium]
MKMNLFWGAVLIFWGITLILKALFKIDIHFFRILLAAILIYFGVKLLVSGWGGKSNSKIVFNNAHITLHNNFSRHSVIFGSSDIDFRNIDLSEQNARAEVDVVFGSANILVDHQAPMKIYLDTVFGDCRIQGKNIGPFSKSVYTTESFKEGEYYLEVELDIVFGSARITYK